MLPLSCIEPSPPMIAVSNESKNANGGEFGDVGPLRSPLLARKVAGLGGGNGRGRPSIAVGNVGGAGVRRCGLVDRSTAGRGRDLLRYGPEVSNSC